ncbi:MAG: hypothetical protein QGI09_05080 [Dehalococcoidia bacterium]|nr:hypothetical protein [Dehalococcoidia bacterium]
MSTASLELWIMGFHDRFGVNTIGEPCDRKDHAQFDGESLALGGLYGWAIYAPGGKDRDQ